MADFRVVLTGGGTAGHVTPLLVVAKQLEEMLARGELELSRRLGRGYQAYYVGTVSELSRPLLEKAKLPCWHVPAGKIRRYLTGTPLTFVDLAFRLPWGILRALWILWRIMPDVVFSKGGYGSVPVVLAAWLYRIPCLIHETDAEPGLTTRRLARLSTSVAVSFARAERRFPADKVFVSGTPIRPDIGTVSPREARERLGLRDGKMVLAVMGGSQGAHRINRTVMEILSELLFRFQVVHLCGRKHEVMLSELAADILKHHPDRTDYHLIGFTDDMPSVYAAADLIVSRAGGTTLAEIAAAGRPSILIPLPSAANDHQRANAFIFHKAGAAEVLEEPNLTPTLLLAAIKSLARNPAVLAEMGERARELARPRAAEMLARVLVLLAEGKAWRAETKTAEEGAS